MHRRRTSESSSAARIQRSIHKYKVVVGCMVCMAVVLGALLLHGAIKALSNVKSVFTVLYTLGFCVLLAAPLLIWSSYTYIQYIERKERNDYYPGGPLDTIESDYPESSAGKAEHDPLDLEIEWKEGLQSPESTELPVYHSEPAGATIAEEDVQEPCTGTHIEDTRVYKKGGDMHSRRLYTTCYSGAR